MWRMLQQPAPDDYVIATNQWHPLTELLDVAFSLVNLTWRDHVESDLRFSLPAESGRLQGDFSKARDRLGWQPRTSFTQLVRLMVEADQELVKVECSSETFGSGLPAGT